MSRIFEWRLAKQLVIKTPDPKTEIVGSSAAS